MKRNKRLWSWALTGALAVSNLSAVAIPMTAFAADADFSVTPLTVSINGGNAVSTNQNVHVGDTIVVTTPATDGGGENIVWSVDSSDDNHDQANLQTVQDSVAGAKTTTFLVPASYVVNETFTIGAKEGSGNAGATPTLTVVATASGSDALSAGAFTTTTHDTLDRGGSILYEIDDTLLPTLRTAGGYTTGDYTEKFVWEIASGSEQVFTVSPIDEKGLSARLYANDKASAGNKVTVKVTYYLNGKATKSTETLAEEEVQNTSEICNLEFKNNDTLSAINNEEIGVGEKLVVVASASPVGWKEFSTNPTFNWEITGGNEAVEELATKTGNSMVFEAKSVKKDTEVKVTVSTTAAKVDADKKDCNGIGTFTFKVKAAPSYSVSVSPKTLTFKEGSTKQRLTANFVIENDNGKYKESDLYYKWLIYDGGAWSNNTNINDIDAIDDWANSGNSINFFNASTTKEVDIALATNDYVAGSALIGVAVYANKKAYDAVNAAEEDGLKVGSKDGLLAVSWIPTAATSSSAYAQQKLDPTSLTSVTVTKDALTVSLDKDEYLVKTSIQNDAGTITVKDADGKIQTSNLEYALYTKASYETACKAANGFSFTRGDQTGYVGGEILPLTFSTGWVGETGASGDKFALAANGQPGAYVLVVRNNKKSIGTYSFMVRTENGVKATGIELDLTDVILANINDTATIFAKVLPYNYDKDATPKVLTTSAEIRAIEAKSSDESVIKAEVSTIAAQIDTDKGSAVKITALKPGKATVTVTAVDGGFTATANVEVNGVESVKVTGANEVSVGKTTALTATVNAYGSAARNVTWSTSDASVATVDANGVVTGVKAGTATITATALADTEKTASITITVKDKTEADKKAEEEAAKKAEEAKKAAEEAAKKAAEEEAKKGVPAGTTKTVSGTTYKGIDGTTVQVTKTKNAKSVKIAKTVKVDGKTLKVTKIGSKAVTGKKVQNVTIDASNIKKAGNININMFKGAKNLKSVKIKGAKKGGAVYKRIVKAAQKVNKNVKIK